jgi:hypothetical protein
MPKLKLDTVNSAKIGKMTEIVILCIVVIKYINMYLRVTRCSKKKILSGIEIDSIA